MRASSLICCRVSPK